MQNQRLLRALLRQPVDTTPVWIMRQAGRYLPEYQETRKKAGDFLTLCKTPELACEVTLQPLARFDLDAAIVFSDILTIPDAMGLGLYFSEGDGPQFKKPIQSQRDIAQLSTPDPEVELRYVTDAIRLIRHELNNKIPLIGFAGSPWTLATYMVEGGPSKNFSIIKSMMYREPQLLENLLAKLTKAVTDYLNAQIRAGVQVVMIFDTWGGILSRDTYQKFSLNPMQKIISGLLKEQNNLRIPSIIFTKGGGQWLQMQAESGANALGLDWTTNISDAVRQVGKQVALQGNLDPCVLYGNSELIEAEVKKIIQELDGYDSHVFNLGHGIYPDIRPENVAILIEAVHNYGRR